MPEFRPAYARTAAPHGDDTCDGHRQLQATLGLVKSWLNASQIPSRRTGVAHAPRLTMSLLQVSAVQNFSCGLATMIHDPAIGARHLWMATIVPWLARAPIALPDNKSRQRQVLSPGLGAVVQ
jgi:hypothetical protein